MKRLYDITIKTTNTGSYFIVSYDPSDDINKEEVILKQIVDIVKSRVADDGTLKVKHNLEETNVSCKINAIESYGEAAIALIDIEHLLMA